MIRKALIFGLRGPVLSAEEKAFFAKEQPWGFILFARNIENPEQVKRLTASLRACVGRDDAPILIDQEGGRVQRFRSPHWYDYPPAATLGALYETDAEKGERAAWLLGRLHAFDLLAAGVTVDCLPVLDVPSPEGHDVIGDRAYGMTPEQVETLGLRTCEGLRAGGVMPVIKHIPGHGRAGADSHFELPVVDADFDTLSKTDFAPFTGLNHIPMAMTAHVIYSAIDPDAPATTSRKVMDEIVRGHMGYDGLVMSDDITMDALSGDLTERTRATFAAGCDIVLHCTGNMDEMTEIAQASPRLEGKPALRAQAALAGIGETDGLSEADCRAEFSGLMGDSSAPDTGLDDAVMAQNGADPTDYGKTA